MKKPLLTRVVRLEEGSWRVRPDHGELDAAEQEELSVYLNEIHLPYQMENGQLRISGSISWETVYECLTHFYDGRAEVYPF